MKNSARAKAVVILLLTGLGLFAGGGSARAAGATLSLSPASGNYGVGKTFTVTVTLASGGGIGVNAADGKVSFDPAALAVQSVSKNNSVFNLWVADPSFSNTDGTVSFSGGGTGAYSGSAGTVMTITFKSLKTGPTDVKFASASALAADGQGTNVLSGTTGATYTIGATGSGGSSGSSGSSSPSPAPSAPQAPVQAAFTVSIGVSSPTNPDQTKWYSNTSPSFAWTLTSDVSGLSTAFDKNAGTYPKRSSEGLISTKSYANVADGTWYFHVRFEDALGNWSDPVNYTAQIDATPPLPFVVNVQTGGGLNGRTLVAFNASDTVSGIDHYAASFDGASSTPIAPSDIQSGVFTAPPLLPGKHVVVIRAYDHAGNFAEASAAFSIDGVAMPNITNFPATVIENSPIVLEGTADSGSNVSVSIIDKNNKTVSEGKMVADETGHWLYAAEGGLSGGVYSLNVSMITTQGATASTTPKAMMNVISAPFIERFGWILVILLLACIGGIISYGFYQKKIAEMRLSLVTRENEEARQKTKIVFEALREELDEQISHMEGGAAQAQGEARLEPEHVLDAMRNAFVASETTIQKEIDDVDKALLDK